MKTFSVLIAAFLIFSSTISAQTLSLGNHIWWDMNDNGKMDNSEFGASGLTVRLYLDNNEDGIADAGFITLTTTTDGSGYYQFTNLNPGKYFVRLSAGSSHYKSTVYGGHPDNNIDGDNNGLTQNLSTFHVFSETITLSPGVEPDGNGNNNTNINNTLDMGIWKGNGLGDFVWLDANGNGEQDGGELGIGNVTVRLKDANGNVLETTTTDNKGYYSFHDPMVYGTTSYQIEFVTPSGLIPSNANAASDDKDSDAVGGIISNVTVPLGEWNHSFDAGFRLLNTLLPLQLNTFQAYSNDNKAELRWMSEYEKDVAHFVIERSMDGKQFSEIGMVLALSNTDYKSSYQFSDKLSADKGLLYYRLKIVDLNGRFEYSQVRIIRVKNDLQSGVTIQAYPNPVVNRARVSIPQTWSNKKVIYQVTTINGSMVKTILRTNSSQTEEIDMSNLPAGTYILNVLCESERAYQLIIKQ